MIRTLSWLTIIAIFTAGTAARGEERLLFLGGHGATTCQRWTTARAVWPNAQAGRPHKKSDDADLFMSVGLEGWALGFISGISRFATNEQGEDKVEQTILCETNDADVLRRVDNFCRDNPASRVYQAVLIVAADLIHDNAERIRKAAEMDRAVFRSVPRCWPNPPLP